MQLKIDLISIITKNFQAMFNFYKDVLGFEVELQLDTYVEFKNEGSRFAITTSKVMEEATSVESYSTETTGYTFELAFGPLKSPEDVDLVFAEIVSKGAQDIKSPTDMPWNQRTAFFADPDGNIHELFADLPK
ncbi:MAG: VOC family protein [Candidatus Kariarchaeaceae archaeon]|jgi:catechol 2,3-dioxygenase-like lactoylglutathione lyase family enzyme